MRPMGESFPKEIIIDSRKETKSVFIGPELQEAMPHVLEAFGKVDKAFLENPEAYITRLYDSVFSFKSKTGAEVACSLLFDDGSKKDELLIIWAPFSDSAPKSSADELYHYITQPLSGGPRGFLAKEQAKPNSWNQTTKSSVIFELLGAVGSRMPVLTIYSPISTGAYTKGERVALRNGDFSSASRIAREAVAEAQQKLHGLHSETRIDKVNLHGASLGASNAIGTARTLLEKDITVPTVTAQELIMGPESFFDVAKRFTIASRTGEPSDIEVPRHMPKVPEPEIRQSIDRNGSELSMLVRMAQAVKPTYLRGLAHPERTVNYIEYLLNNNVSLLIALAENSGLTRQTKNYLPNDREKVITVRGREGQYADHLIDEHVALTSLVAALGIKARAS